MKQVTVKAVTGFEHNGTRNRGDTFVVSDQHAHALQARGLVKVVSATDEAEQAKATVEAARKAAASVQTTSRKRQSAHPKEPKTEKPEGTEGDKATSENQATHAEPESNSGEKQSEVEKYQTQTATDNVASLDSPAAPGIDQA